MAKPVIGGGPGVQPAGEKPKNFKRTLGKLIKYTKSSLPVIILSFVFAIAAVILTLNVPNILGDGTDTLVSGVTQMSIYRGIEKEVEAQGGTMEQLSKTYPTLRDYINANPDSESEMIKNVPEKYRDDVLNMEMKKSPGIDIDAIFKILIVICVLILISGAISYMQGFLLAGVAQKVSYRFRRDIDMKINKLPLKYFDSTSNGEVLSYLSNDVDTISTTLNQSLSQLITSITTLVGVLVMMIRISLIMTGITILIVPISFLLIMIVVKKSQKHFINQQKFLGNVNGHIEEMYSGHKEVTLYNSVDDSLKTFTQYNDKLAYAGKKSQFLSGLMMPIMNFVGNIGYVATCVVGGVLTIGGSLSVGNIQAFIQYIRQFNQPIAQMANIVNTLQSTVAAAERVFNFMEAEEEIQTGDKVPVNTKGDVEFKNVRFGYSEDKIVINDFSSVVHAGDRVAIVGPTGAGKTTMVKLLMRFYDLNGGDIYLDNVNVKEYSREGMRTDFGMVLQETWLFNGTIMENIRYGNLNATDEQVMEAAKVACADHFIKTLPLGYNFEINEEAGNLSGGQKQLLTIARAVLADPKVLILDEATSNVDTRTELLIQKAMNRLMENRTSFVIAHRLSTIKDADKILVMKDGDIIEQGSHEELMVQGGFYCELYNSQFA